MVSSEERASRIIESSLDRIHLALTAKKIFISNSKVFFGIIQPVTILLSKEISVLNR